MYVRRRRLGTAICVIMAGLIGLTGAVPASAETASPIGSPSRSGSVTFNEESGSSFQEVRFDGTLWTYNYWGDYTGIYEMAGWGNTRLIATLTHDHFMEVKGDDLWEWKRSADGRFYRSHVAVGMSNARLMTALSPTEFLVVRTDGQLITWNYDRLWSKWYDWYTMKGWGNTDLIAGLDDNTFLEVKDGELREWFNYGGGWQWYHRDWGWSNARLITGVGQYTFVSVKTDGTLWQWTWNEATRGYVGTHVDSGWGNARLLG